MTNKPEEITIRGDAIRGLLTVSVRLTNSRLQWQAPGLDIYTYKVPFHLYPQAYNLACNEAIARHIPAVSVRRVGK